MKTKNSADILRIAGIVINLLIIMSMFMPCVDINAKDIGSVIQNDIGEQIGGDIGELAEFGLSIAGDLFGGTDIGKELSSGLDEIELKISPFQYIFSNKEIVEKVENIYEDIGEISSDLSDDNFESFKNVSKLIVGVFIVVYAMPVILIILLILNGMDKCNKKIVTIVSGIYIIINLVVTIYWMLIVPSSIENNILLHIWKKAIGLGFYILLIGTIALMIWTFLFAKESAVAIKSMPAMDLQYDLPDVPMEIPDTGEGITMTAQPDDNTDKNIILGCVVSLEGTQKGKEYIFRQDEEISIGRSEKNDIVINNPRISGVHCKLQLTDDGESYIVSCLSENGLQTTDGHTLGKLKQVIIERGQTIVLDNGSEIWQLN